MLSSCTVAAATRRSSSTRSFASLSALRRQTNGLVYTQIEDAGPCTGARRYNAANDAFSLSSAPVWRSGTVRAAPNAINAAAAQALMEAHSVALQKQAEQLRAEASASLASTMREQQRLLSAAQQEIQTLQQDLEAKRQELQQQIDKHAAVSAAPAAHDADEEIERLRSQLLNVRGLLRVAVLDKTFTETPMAELLSLPASALQGVGGKTATTLESAGIATVGDLAAWKVVEAARAACAAQGGSTPAVGLASCTDEAIALRALRLKTAEDVADWKFAAIAQALETMAVEAMAQQQEV